MTIRPGTQTVAAGPSGEMTLDELYAAPHIGAGDLAALPGGDLAMSLEWFDPEGADEATLVEAVAAARRLLAWAHHRSAVLAGQLATRESMNPHWSPVAGPAPTQACVAGDEIAMRTMCSRRTGHQLVREGHAYTGALTATGDALARGDLDPHQAAIVVQRLEPLALQVALDVQHQVLPGADRRTPTQLGRDIERALLTADPTDAAARATRARTTRRVEHLRLLPDGMASLRAVLPATDAIGIDTTLDAAARTARTAGDPRTLDQLRADGLRDLILHTTCTSTTTSPDPQPDPDRNQDQDQTDADRALPRASARPDQSVRPTVQAHAPTAPTRTAPRPAPHEPPAPDPPATIARPGPRTTPRRPAPVTVVHVTVPLSTLIGTSDLPGELEGVGPVDATTARALAAHGTWRRLVTDPLSGTVLDVGRTTHQPPADLDRHVRARDRCCARPGCTTPARAADLDHTNPYSPNAPEASRARRTLDDDPGPGRTAADNLGPLCRRDHRLKTDGGYTLHQVRPGVFEWTSPTGQRYRVTPGDNGRNEHLGLTPRHPPGPPPPF